MEKPSVTETIRAELKQTKASLYRVAKDSGVSWATLQRFRDGGGLRSEHVDALARYFGFELAKPGPMRRRKEN